jgi:hypothetical protein
MKNIRFKYIGVLLLLVLVLGSCKKWIDTGLNVNPDAPSDVPMSSLVPAIEANMAYTTIDGNDYSRVTSQWMQYYQGIARQSQGESNYIWHDGDVDNVWNTSYSGIMMNIDLLTTKARAATNLEGHFTYLGIADVLMAESLGFVTDLWGDAPFSGAFQGLSNLSPVFDSQETLYAKINSLLDEAIASLSDPNAIAVRGDLIYDGDPARWLKAAHGLKARYILHTSKRDPQAYSKALAALTGALASNDDDMQFPFGENVGQQNPLYQFMTQRGDIAMHKTFMDMLIIRQDPRLTVYAGPGADTANPYQGANWGSTGETASPPGPAVNTPDAPVLFMTYAECLFIKAECEFMANPANPDPQVKLDILAGVTASLDKWNAPNAQAYITGYKFYLDTVSVSLYWELLTQKYIALFNQSESFNDWRRTNNVIGLAPNPTSSAIRNEIPRRFPYSLGEKSYNTNTPKDVTMWDRVWWDKAK